MIGGNHTYQSGKTHVQNIKDLLYRVRLSHARWTNVLVSTWERPAHPPFPQKPCLSHQLWSSTWTESWSQSCSLCPQAGSVTLARLGATSPLVHREDRRPACACSHYPSPPIHRELLLLAYSAPKVALDVLAASGLATVKIHRQHFSARSRSPRR